jgi:hypothetical protein
MKYIRCQSETHISLYKSAMLRARNKLWYQKLDYALIISHHTGGYTVI